MTKKSGSEEMVPIRFTWSEARPDPAQFKPMQPTLLPINVQVEICVPASTVIKLDEEGGVIILTPYGLAFALKQLLVEMRKTYSEL